MPNQTRCVIFPIVRKDTRDNESTCLPVSPGDTQYEASPPCPDLAVICFIRGNRRPRENFWEKLNKLLVFVALHTGGAFVIKRAN